MKNRQRNAKKSMLIYDGKKASQKIGFGGVLGSILGGFGVVLEGFVGFLGLLGRFWPSFLHAFSCSGFQECFWRLQEAYRIDFGSIWVGSGEGFGRVLGASGLDFGGFRAILALSVPLLLRFLNPCLGLPLIFD